MIQLLLILAIIICLIILLLNRKEQFVLPSITSLKATGGNGGIKLTWIKPNDNIDRYYIILKFDKDGIPNYNIYLYNNNNDLVEFHIKNIPNDYIYNVSIIYKSGNNISLLNTYQNKDGNNNIITDANSPLNFNDKDEEEKDAANTNGESNDIRCKSKHENINMELKNIMNLLINMDKSEPTGNYNVNIY